MRMLRKSCLCLGLACAALGVTVDARAQGSKWWQSDKYKQELALSADQISRLEAVFQATEPTLRTQKAALEKCEDTLSRVISDKASDEHRVVAAVDKVDAARAELSRTRTVMLFRMRRILTDEQNARMKALHERDRDHRPRGDGPLGEETAAL